MNVAECFSSAHCNGAYFSYLWELGYNGNTNDIVMEVIIITDLYR